MGEKSLVTIEEEKDLGVLIYSKLDFRKHIKKVVAKANSVLDMIRVSFACMNKIIPLSLYPALMRPLFEHCVQVWFLYKRKHKFVRSTEKSN